MPLSATAVLLSSVALLVITGFFLLALIPLLLLKHDSPQDSQLVQRLLSYYYAAAIFMSIATALSYAASGMPMPAFAAAVLVSIGIVLRRHFLPAIESLRASLPFSTGTVWRFRKLHTGAIAANFVQLMAVVGIVNSYPPI